METMEIKESPFLFEGVKLIYVLGDREAKIQIPASPFWQKKQDPIQFGPS